jgi:hypothetical protein
MSFTQGNPSQPATLRDESDQLSPSFWNGPWGTRLRFAMSILHDGNAQQAEFAVQAQAPSIAPTDALPWIGIDRLIQQGYQESLTSWRARLIQWLDRHAYRGKATGVMLWARGWILPQLPRMRVVTNSGTWWTYNEGVDPMPAGAQTVTPAAWVAPGYPTWNWDGNTKAWWRSFLIIYATGVPWVTTGWTWGDGHKWGDGNVWGFGGGSATAIIVQGLRAAVASAKARHAWYPWIIVSFADTLFDPAFGADGIHNPNGTFGNASIIVNGQYVSSRFATARYISGPTEQP